mmetsp:Transcript_1277/g.2080  ORF Transcript_1277/g.2080 Transcript_1277/m.2080 type:complete len:84 (-) Transcript_1277:1145-1396(-)
MYQLSTTLEFMSWEYNEQLLKLMGLIDNPEYALQLRFTHSTTLLYRMSVCGFEMAYTVLLRSEFLPERIIKVLVSLTLWLQDT